MEAMKSSTTKFYVFLVLVIYIIICLLVLSSLNTKSFIEEVKNLSEVSENVKNRNLRIFNHDFRAHPPGKDNITKITLGLLVDENEMIKQQQGYLHYSYNVLVSERIGNQSRILPDSRPSLCKVQKFIKNILLNQASIIIYFRDELETILLRTISSILNNTPLDYVKEIFVINAMNSSENLNLFLKHLTDYEKSKIRIFKMRPELGKIKSQMTAAKMCKGEVLIFLSSRCEVNVGWIQPLITGVKIKSRTVIAPTLDVIDGDTFEYITTPVGRAGFDWQMHVTKEKVTAYPPSSISSYPTPILPESIFAISSKDFFAIGGFDEYMSDGGSDNFEISFRTWQCNGRVVINPCSRVGLLRPSSRPLGGAFDSPIKSRQAESNRMRAVMVWMDKYQVHVKWKQPRLRVSVGNISRRADLRKKLNCSSFYWYLNNVYPQLGIPGVRSSSVQTIPTFQTSKTLALGQLAVSNLPICVTADDYASSVVWAANCDPEVELPPNQKWWYTVKGQIRFGPHLCLSGIVRLNSSPSLTKCDDKQSTQRWAFINNQLEESKNYEGFLYNVASGLCLSVNKFNDKYKVLFRLCKNPNIQTFYFASNLN